MEYSDASRLIKEIEHKYDVLSIKYEGVSIWPYLRIYLLDGILSKPTEQKVTSSNVSLVLRSLFFYNPIKFFRHYNIWVYDGTITRKKVGAYFIHHVTGAMNDVYPDYLLIENPEGARGHYSKKVIPEKNVISNVWTVLIARIIDLFINKSKLFIENEDLLRNILLKNELKFDYLTYLKHLLSQKKAVDFVLTLTRNPKVVLIICAYGRMGYIWSFHNHNIPVIELQHGVLNANHFAYNSLFHSDLLYPDEIGVYGVVEYEYFKSIQKQYSRQVSMSGLYMLERADELFDKDIFREYRSKYSLIIVIAGQTGMEETMMSFVNEVAKIMKEALFVYIPRRNESDFNFESHNVFYKPGVNIYEYLKWCDIHCTISSTTCLEAHYFKKPVIFYETEKSVAKEYYGDILGESNGTYYVKDIKEFQFACSKLSDGNYVYKDIFAHDCRSRFKKMIEKYL